MNSKALLVNGITFLRTPLILAWLGLAVLYEYQSDSLVYGFLACAAMLASGVSDMVDGMLARRWRVVSTLGKMADPLMDKIFYVVAFPALVWQAAHQGEDLHALVLLGFTILYLARDMWVTFMRSVGTMFGANVAAMTLGKVRTALSFPAAGWVYMYLSFHHLAPVAYVSAWRISCYAVEGLLMTLTLVSLFTYTFAYRPYLRRALERDR